MLEVFGKEEDQPGMMLALQAHLRKKGHFVDVFECESRK